MYGMLCRYCMGHTQRSVGSLATIYELVERAILYPWTPFHHNSTQVQSSHVAGSVMRLPVWDRELQCYTDHRR